MDFKATFKRYYVLSKPGIIRANVITALAGYLLASQFNIDGSVLVGLLVGSTLIIAGACAYNNYIDRGIDRAMARTKKRALVTGEMSGRSALTYATITTLLGFAIVGRTQNGLTTVLLMIAFIDYVVLYGISKRKSVHGTLVGCISGAMSLVAGYTAVTNQIDLGGWLLFIIMVAWQMAHFYGIALYRLADYKAAKIPVMPAVKGVQSTKLQVLVYMVAFIIACITLGLAGYIGVIATVVLVMLGVAWFVKAARSYHLLAADVWGRQVFLFSLLVMLGMSIMLSVGPLLV